MQKDGDKIFVFVSLPPFLPILSSQTSYFQKTRTKTPGHSGITFYNFKTREENQPPAPIQNIPGIDCNWPLLGSYALWGTMIHGSHQKHSVEKGRKISSKGNKERHTRQTKINQHLPQTPGVKVRESALGGNWSYPKRQREDKEVKFCRSQGGAVRKRGMTEKLRIERERKIEAVGLGQHWPWKSQFSVCGNERWNWKQCDGATSSNGSAVKQSKRRGVAGKCHEAKKIHFKTDKTRVYLYEERKSQKSKNG